jgi:hypothetical protein
MNESQNTSLTVQQQHLNAVVQWTDDDLNDPATIFTSMPLDTEEQRMLVQQLRNADCRAGESLLGTTFEITDVICHPCDMTDTENDGEIVKGVRTLLVSPGQEPVAFVSVGIRNAIYQLASVFGPPPWWPPIIVQLKLSRTRRGWKTYKLIAQGRAEGR